MIYAAHMSDLNQVAKLAMTLPPGDRLALAETLLLTVPDTAEEAIEEAVIEEAERRHQELVSGVVKGIPAEMAIQTARAAIRCTP